MAAALKITFSNNFFLKVIVFRFKFHWNLFLRAQLAIRRIGPRKRLGNDSSHNLNQSWPSLMTHICVILLRCVKVCKQQGYRCTENCLSSMSLWQHRVPPVMTNLASWRLSFPVIVSATWASHTQTYGVFLNQSTKPALGEMWCLVSG